MVTTILNNEMNVGSATSLAKTQTGFSRQCRIMTKQTSISLDEIVASCVVTVERERTFTMVKIDFVNILRKFNVPLYGTRMRRPNSSTIKGNEEIL